MSWPPNILTVIQNFQSIVFNEKRLSVCINYIGKVAEITYVNPRYFVDGKKTIKNGSQDRLNHFTYG